MQTDILKLYIALTFIIATLFTLGYGSSAKAQTLKADSIDNGFFFTFNSITETEFRNALKDNYNAPIITIIDDTTKLEKAFEAIDKTYDEREIEFAESELCKSPRCLTSFKAYYPTLDLYLFHILDYHYSNAVFVSASTNEVASGYRRFRGEYGAMSKDGIWVGLERGDCDNHLQLEICKTSEYGVYSIFRFDFSCIDINEEESIVTFWADKNKIYLATKEYGEQSVSMSFHSIIFNF